MKAKRISSFAESVESGGISASRSEWKIGSDEFFVTCLNYNSDKVAKRIKNYLDGNLNDSDKLAKPIKNYLDLFINTTSLNHMPFRSRLVSQPNKK